MSDEEFEKEAAELREMLRNLRLIKDKGQRRRYKAEIRHQLTQTMKD